MRTPSPEKDNLLRPTVPEKIEYQILKNEVFFAPPFIHLFQKFTQTDRRTQNQWPVAIALATLYALVQSKRLDRYTLKSCL